MKKLLLITLLAFISISLKAQYYQIGYDSVRIKPKLKLGTVTTGQATDSVLVKTPDGTIYKIARSSLVQTLSLGATNGNVAISGGNNVTLNTLGQSATYNGDANAVARFALAGLSTYVNGSSSTNFPSTGGGAGILLVRIAGSSSGAIEINRPTGSDSTIYIRNGNTSLGWSPWMALPSKVALALKANIASPTFTGVPAAPTPASNVNTTQIVTGAWVNTYFMNLASAQTAAGSKQFTDILSTGNSNVQAQFNSNPSSDSRIAIAMTANSGASTADFIRARTSGGTSVFRVGITGDVIATQFKLSALNTAPASATDTGTLGEIRVTSGFIYVCISSNVWVRANLASW